MASIGDLEMTLNPDDAIDALMTIRLMATKALQLPGNHWQLFLAKIEQRAAEALAKAHEARASRTLAADAIHVGDCLLFSVGLLQDIRSMPDHESLPAYVNEIERNPDGTLTVSLSREQIEGGFCGIPEEYLAELKKRLAKEKDKPAITDAPLESPSFLRAVQALADAEAAERAAIERDKPPRCSATLCGLVCTYPAGHEGVHGYVDPKRLEPPPDLPRGGFF